MNGKENCTNVSRREFTQLTLATATMSLWCPLGKSSAIAAGIAPEVETAGGTVSGYATETLNVFKGIPYGADTGASGRFKAPSAVNAWKDKLIARAVGDPCYQINDDWKGWTDDRAGSEDCLRLNVWSPIGAKNKPVMVFLHGGGYRFGSGGVPLYDGGHLADRGDVVVVTLNHRLHVLGFAYFGDIAPGAGFAANAGLIDLVQALQWVKDNIASFGGDPQNITIFGESGGGGKVSCLMAMPSAKGLFQRAIVQSGAQRKVRTRDAATKDTLALLGELGIGKEEVTKLAAIPVEKLYAAYQKLASSGNVAAILSNTPFSPVIDGEVLPWHPSDKEAVALSRSVDKLYGTNSHELLYYLDFAGLLGSGTTEEKIVNEAMAYFGNLPPERAADLKLLLEEYKGRNPGVALDRIKVRLFSDLWMASDTLQKCADASSVEESAPVYHYTFTWEEPYKQQFWAVHGAELLFVFDNVNADEMWGEAGAPTARANRDPEGRRYLLRDNVVSAWTSFARTGKPVLHDGRPWPAFGPSEFMTMALGEECQAVSDYYGEKIRGLLEQFDHGVGS
uniref:carboxylesterase/lipase family protein n=1 Tax=Ensifer adhaerens TaxID=106592 RepID=UPI003F494CEE